MWISSYLIKNIHQQHWTEIGITNIFQEFLEAIFTAKMLWRRLKSNAGTTLKDNLLADRAKKILTRLL